LGFIPFLYFLFLIVIFVSLFYPSKIIFNKATYK